MGCCYGFIFDPLDEIPQRAPEDPGSLQRSVARFRSDPRKSLRPTESAQE